MLTKLTPALAAAVLLSSPVVAQDVIELPPAAAPADGAAVTQIETPEQKQARANAEWVRRVMAGEPTAEDGEEQAAAKGCVRNPDRKPHGVVWGSVGTGGYKSGGAIVTQPVGDCGSLTVGYEHSHPGNGNIGRRRR